MDDEENFSRLDFGFLLISFKKTFFPKFELLNSRSAYLRVFTVHILMWLIRFLTLTGKKFVHSIHDDRIK